MTGRPTPGRNTGPHRDTRWILRAICTPEHAWTMDNKPPTDLMVTLRAICDRCPVQPDCAAHALEANPPVHAGVYAGVYLPHRTNTDAYRHARQVLRHKAKAHIA